MTAPRARRGVAALTLLLVACTSAPASDPAAAPPTADPTVPADDTQIAEGGGTFRFGLSEPRAIVPAHASGSDELAVVNALFDSLTRWGEDLEPQPAAAIRWRANEDATEWTFFLRRGATFHDGSPVTADDVKFAWELAVREDVVGYHLRQVAGYAALRDGDADELAGVEARGEHLLHVRLRAPNAEFPAVVAHPALAPIPREAWEADPAAFREQPVGNGPFAAAEAWSRGTFLRAARFEDWRNGDGDPAHLDEVVFQFTDLDSAYLAFQQGRLDFTELPPDALDDARSRYPQSEDGYDGPGVLQGDAPTVYFLGFDLDEPPFDDVEVRRAMSMAADRSAIADDNLGGNLSPAQALVPPALSDARPMVCTACRHDPDEAAEIFADRGIDELTLWFNQGGGHEPVARQLRADLADTGVRLTFRTVEFDDYLDRLEGGDAALYRFGWTLDYPTMANALVPLTHSMSTPESGGFNYGGYAEGDVDALLDEARATRDPQERQRRYLEAEELVLDRDQAVVPLVSYHHGMVASERVEGLRHSPMGTTNLAEVRIVEDD